MLKTPAKILTQTVFIDILILCKLNFKPPPIFSFPQLNLHNLILIPPFNYGDAKY